MKCQASGHWHAWDNRAPVKQIEPQLLIAEEHSRLIKELEKRKANVVSGFRLDIMSKSGGGIRCATHPLLLDL